MFLRGHGPRVLQLSAFTTCFWASDRVIGLPLVPLPLWCRAPRRCAASAYAPPTAWRAILPPTAAAASSPTQQSRPDRPFRTERWPLRRDRFRREPAAPVSHRRDLLCDRHGHHRSRRRQSPYARNAGFADRSSATSTPAERFVACTGIRVGNPKASEAWRTWSGHFARWKAAAHHGVDDEPLRIRSPGQ